MAPRQFAAAGLSDPGRQRQVNEDRFHVDLARGIFIVIDGVGGQAAGGKAADVALVLLRERLERETGPVRERIREAITIANNEIYRLAATRSEWDGMACVLTLAVIEDDMATIGHVGDTRLYRIGARGLEKVTKDHSPVGEREDAHELSEGEAMRHPRRNEVYRDVGSDVHAPSDPEFVDVEEIHFAPESALLLCSDGLTDLLDSASIDATVRRLAGDPQSVVASLVDAANDAGGKDNVTVVYIEGARFADVCRAALVADATPDHDASKKPQPWVRRLGLFAAALLLVLVGVVLGRSFDVLQRWFEFLPTLQSAAILPSPPPIETQVVLPTGSIVSALNRAAPGSQILVEPGEYREQLILRDRVRIASRVPGGASLRLPVNASDGPAVIAHGLSHAEFVGFRIVGDAATPLGVGIFVDDSSLSIVDVEIRGATRAGIEFAGARPATLLASDIHDNPGAAVMINRPAAPRIAHNAFRRNGSSERAIGMLAVDGGAAPLFQKNVFIGVSADAFAALEQSTRLLLSADNWFIAPAGAKPAVGPSRPGGVAPSRTPPTKR
jgi:serine/threonine protein phosphatase PrpC